MLSMNVRDKKTKKKGFKSLDIFLSTCNKELSDENQNKQLDSQTNSKDRHDSTISEELSDKKYTKQEHLRYITDNIVDINEAVKLLGKENITNEYIKQQYGDEAFKKVRACSLFDYDNGWYVNEEGQRILKNKNKTPVKREEEKYERMLREGFVAVDENGRIVKIIRENVVNYILETEPPFFTIDDTEEMFRYTNGVYTPWKEYHL